jgi:hypothetical protein
MAAMQAAADALFVEEDYEGAIVAYGEALAKNDFSSGEKGFCLWHRGLTFMKVKE